MVLSSLSEMHRLLVGTHRFALLSWPCIRERMVVGSTGCRGEISAFQCHFLGSSTETTLSSSPIGMDRKKSSPWPGIALPAEGEE